MIGEIISEVPEEIREEFEREEVKKEVVTSFEDKALEKIALFISEQITSAEQNFILQDFEVNEMDNQNINNDDPLIDKSKLSEDELIEGISKYLSAWADKNNDFVTDQLKNSGLAGRMASDVLASMGLGITQKLVSGLKKGATVLTIGTLALYVIGKIRGSLAHSRADGFNDVTPNFLALFGKSLAPLAEEIYNQSLKANSLTIFENLSILSANPSLFGSVKISITDHLLFINRYISVFQLDDPYLLDPKLYISGVNAFDSALGTSVDIEQFYKTGVVLCSTNELPISVAFTIARDGIISHISKK